MYWYFILIYLVYITDTLKRTVRKITNIDRNSKNAAKFHRKSQLVGI